VWEKVVFCQKWGGDERENGLTAKKGSEAYSQKLRTCTLPEEPRLQKSRDYNLQSGQKVNDEYGHVLPESPTLRISITVRKRKSLSVEQIASLAKSFVRKLGD